MPNAYTVFFMFVQKDLQKTARKGFPLRQRMSKRPDQDASGVSPTGVVVTGAASVMPPVRPREKVMRSP